MKDYTTPEQVVSALRATKSESKRVLLDTAADMIERMMDKPVASNADRIRAMSDEELAEMFAPNMCPYLEDDCTRLGCKECILKWLKSPAKEDA